MAFYSATLLGVQPIPVEIEIDISGGLPFFQIVGLPDAVLKESKTRVKSAIIQAGFDFPYDQRVVLNLAPSEVKKEGSGFELGLAARILASSGQIPSPGFNTLFLGELALDGSVRPVPEIGALSYAADDFDCLVVPKKCLKDVAEFSPRCRVVGLSKIQELHEPLWWEVFAQAETAVETDGDGSKLGIETPTLGAWRTLEKTRFSKFWARHLEIAAVGRMHYLLCGPPGCGKTFFAESLRVIRERLPRPDAREVRVLDAFFHRDENLLPWSAPHHSSTCVGLVGGGNPPRPGAITKAHGGILFLDELLEFRADVLDSLREPIEKGFIEVHRAGQHVNFPSRFQLIAATNPCRCGFYKHKFKRCTCQTHQRQMYQARMSGPFFDRFDVRLICETPLGNEPTVTGAHILKRILAVTDFKKERRSPSWSPPLEKFFARIVDDRAGSYRVRGKTRQLAETLAMLDSRGQIEEQDVTEAVDLQRFGGLDPGC